MKKSQASLETIFVVGISTALLIPAAYLFTEFLLSSRQGIIENQITRIGTSITENAYLIYFYGDKAKTSADYYFPEGINNMRVERNKMLVFEVETSNGMTDYTFNFDVNVTALFNESCYQEGEKTFMFKTINNGDSVLIKRVSR